MDQKNIRNFSIIAHIDHGKSTLADRILEMTDTVEKREMKDQILDSMDLERERGITIKLNAVQLVYHAKDGQDYLFHLIDTPGHVDFTYEVSRSLAACDGAVLVVDAAQGVQAQTLANVYLALDNDLEILPVLNKIDLPSAQPDVVRQEIEDLIGLDCSDAVEISAKSGLNVDQVLEEIVKRLPAPKGDRNKPLQALVFDSLYDPYRGVIAFVSIKNGTVKKGDRIRFMATGAEYEVTEVGVRTPKEVVEDQLNTGDVGWISAAIKNIEDVRVGDTITRSDAPAAQPLEGYKEMQPMVYAGLYPVDNARYEDLKDALAKLKLNDASLHFEPETSQALGFGFRCGFLGLLHMDVIEERLEREYNLNLIATSPSVIYKVYRTDGTVEDVDNPAALPPAQNIDHIEEPYVRAEIMVPKEYVGAIMDLCQKKRGEYIDMQVLDDIRMNLIYEMPLSEIIFDFFDKMKSSTKGYASFDYSFSRYKTSNLVKMDILLNGQVIDALSIIVHKDFAYNRGNAMTIRLKELIPKQQFEIPVQAAIGGKVIARTNIKALRKNVLAKCYGGDISRKKKLLE
ncbi:translation elongation factor 4, partial [uncultured Faecalibaculum sp.]